jgi:hypothetical protein
MHCNVENFPLNRNPQKLLLVPFLTSYCTQSITLLFKKFLVICIIKLVVGYSATIGYTFF